MISETALLRSEWSVRVPRRDDGSGLWRCGLRRLGGLVGHTVGGVDDCSIWLMSRVGAYVSTLGIRDGSGRGSRRWFGSAGNRDSHPHEVHAWGTSPPAAGRTATCRRSPE